MAWRVVFVAVLNGVKESQVLNFKESVALSFTGASGKEDLIRIRQLQMMAGGLWPEKWLEERGLEEWAKSWRQLYDYEHSTKKLEVA